MNNYRNKPAQSIGTIIPKTLHSAKRKEMEEGVTRGYPKERTTKKTEPKVGWIHENVCRIPQTELPWTSKGLLILLSRRAGWAQVCWTSYEGIHRDTGIGSYTTISKAQKALVDQGYIFVLPKCGPRGDNVYILSNKVNGEHYRMDWVKIKGKLQDIGIKPEVLKKKLPTFYALAKLEVSKGEYIKPVKEYFGL